MTMNASSSRPRVLLIAATGIIAAILDIWSKQTALSWFVDFPSDGSPSHHCLIGGLVSILV